MCTGVPSAAGQSVPGAREKTPEEVIEKLAPAVLSALLRLLKFTSLRRTKASMQRRLFAHTRNLVKLKFKAWI